MLTLKIVEYWFDKVGQIAKNAGLTDVKTEALVEAEQSILNYSVYEA